jgi:hypothetical protein
MKGTVLALVVVVMILVVLVAVAKASTNRTGSVKYLLRPLMTARELEFFGSLRSALPEAVIHAQVAMSALVDVKSSRISDRNRFDRKVFDFVVCKHDGAVLYAVELDDRSHGRASARKRDAVKDEIAAAVGLRLIRYKSVRVDAASLRLDFDRAAAGGDVGARKEPTL